MVLMIDSGCISASKLCHDAGKDFKFSKRCKHAVEFVYTFEEAENLEVGIHTSKFIGSVIDGNRGDDGKLISGHYAHPLLIPHITSWASYENVSKSCKD